MVSNPFGGLAQSHPRSVPFVTRRQSLSRAGVECRHGQAWAAKQFPGLASRRFTVGSETEEAAAKGPAPIAEGPCSAISSLVGWFAHQYVTWGFI